MDEDTAVDAYIGKRIGSHVRHVTDHMVALLRLSESDTVDYNLRSRNSPTETDIAYALTHINDLIQQVDTVEFGPREVVCVSEIDVREAKSAAIPSTADREALWVFNHTIHHIALIKTLAEQAGLEFDANLGVAPATASFLRAGN